MRPRRRSSPAGYWCPVLHAHLPWVRHPDQPFPLEEDWFFEALTETYVPLLSMLHRLVEDGISFRLTMTLSPTLLSMMADALLVERYHAHLDRLIALAGREVERTRREAPGLTALASVYLGEFRQVRVTFRETY